VNDSVADDSEAWTLCQQDGSLYIDIHDYPTAGAVTKILTGPKTSPMSKVVCELVYIYIQNNLISSGNFVAERSAIIIFTLPVMPEVGGNSGKLS
jgi:hypothetical protein